MQHIQGQERSQVTLFPNVLDDYVADENPVRFLDAFVDGLDLAGLDFRHAVLQETGRPPYHPAELFCRQLDLFGGELVAIDGSKFKPQNAKGRNFTQKKLKRQIKDLDKKIDDYLEQLDRADEEEKDTPAKPNAEQLREKIEQMKRR